MARRTALPSTTPRWLLVALVAVLAIGAIVLTLLALNHVRTRTTGGDVTPVPTFTQPAQRAPSPTPSETVAPETSYDRSQERFLTVSAGVLWRGIAGQCGRVEPLLERSVDDGQTWIDVTPRYLGIGQLVALNPFADGQAEIIALVGADCELQALRTFTQGQFWESYEDVLATSDFVNPADSAVVVRGSTMVAAPCSDARGLRGAGTALAIVCDGSAYALDQESEWRLLPSTSVVALNVAADQVAIAHASEHCDGLAITRHALTDDTAPQAAECAQTPEPRTPTAIAFFDQAVIIWSDAGLSSVPAGRM